MAEQACALQIPVDDGAIPRAFEALDAQMNAWVSAMQRIEQSLRSSTSPEEPRTACETVEAVAIAPQILAPVQAEPDPAPVQQDVEEPAPDVAAVTVQEEAATSVAVPTGLEKSPAVVNDDEALLATLDPETASTIRVMRRMSMSRRSVRELLAELESKQRSPSAPAAESKKSWWRR